MRRICAGTTPVERRIQVIDHEADVVDSGPAALDEAAHWGLRGGGFQELDHRISGGETDDAGTVGVVERDLGESEDIAVEGHGVVEGTHGDANMCDAGAAGALWAG